MSGTTIHQNLHAALLVVHGAMVGGYRRVTADKVDHHARHQAEHFVKVHNAEITNQVAFYHRCATGNPDFGLAQLGGCQYFRDIFTEPEIAVGNRLLTLGEGRGCAHSSNQCGGAGNPAAG